MPTYTLVLPSGIDLLVTLSEDGKIANVAIPSGNPSYWRVIQSQYGVDVSLVDAVIRDFHAFMTGVGVTLPQFAAYMVGKGGQKFFSFLKGKGGRKFSAFLKSKGGRMFGCFLTSLTESAIVRNCRGTGINYLYMGTLQNGMSRDNSSNTGTATQLNYFAAFAVNPVGVVRNNNYIYWFVADRENMILTYYELNIDTDVTRSVVLINDPDDSFSPSSISFIEERKILATPCSWNNLNAYIIDFADLSTAQIGSHSYPTAGFILTGGGHLHFVLAGYAADYSGPEIKWKNYTTDGVWHTFTTAIHSSYVIGPGLQVGDYFILTYRYVVTGQSYIGAHVLNLITGNVTQTNTITFPSAGGVNNLTCALGDHTVDVPTQTGYFNAHGTKLVGTLYATVDIEISISPEASALSIVYSRSANDVPLASVYSAYLTSNKDNAYFILTPSYEIIRASDLTNLGSFSATGTSRICVLADDNGFWAFDSTAKTLVKRNFSGSTITTLTPSIGGVYPISNAWNLGNLQDKLFVAFREQQPDSYNAWTYVYLIT